jgi:hypothetical protein
LGSPKSYGDVRYRTKTPERLWCTVTSASAGSKTHASSQRINSSWRGTKKEINNSMKTSRTLGTCVALVGAALTAHAQHRLDTLVVTASNADTNQLLVYDANGQLTQTISTQGKGGASGNAGGIAATDGTVAVVNYGSQTVAILNRRGNGFSMGQLVNTASAPLSVAFGADHLYVLGTTKVESHRITGSHVATSPDGVVPLLLGDGSAAQVGVLPNQLIISEKSNMIETVNLMDDGSVGGTATAVQNIPSNVNAPFGLITRGTDAYVTIAHADEISLVRGGKVLTTTPSGTQHAPCWLALVGPFLYSSNSPSMSISRYAVYGQKIVQDAAVAAQLNGNPSDIASGDGLIAVIDGAGSTSHLSIFSMDQDGNLSLVRASTINAPANGVAVIRSED